MAKINYIFPILISIILSSCEKYNNCFESHGASGEETRWISEGFHTIEMHDYVDVYIYDSQAQEKLIITGGNNLLNTVKTEIKDSVLFIRQELTCKWSRTYDEKYAVHVPIKKLKQLRYYGSGDIQSIDTIYSDTTIIDSWKGTGSFKLNLKANKIILGINSGTVDMKIKGKTNELYIWQQGLGKIDASDVISPYGWVDSGATGNSYIGDSYQRLDIMLYGLGNIYYGGQPDINVMRYDGPGKLIHQ